MTFCSDCLKPTEQVFEDKGNLVCPNCYHKRYSNKPCNTGRCENPTILDLKEKWETKNAF